MMRLTPAQAEVLRYRREGLIGTEIAHERTCSEHTVREIERQVRTKFGVPRTRTAVRLATRMGLL